ncbi:MAG: lysophospholipase [Pseudomonadota bacterium]
MAMAIEGKLVIKSGVEAGASLHYKYWSVANPKAVALIAHGYAEHLGRYEHVAAALNKAGYAVVALDHWGHGKSEGARSFIPSFSVFLDGLDALLAEVKTTYPDQKRFLIGHSMGGLIAATYLVNRQDEFAGAVLSGPSLVAAETPSAAAVFIGRILSKLAPKAGILPLDALLISRDPKVVADYIADPLVYKGKIGARFAAEMLDAMTEAAASAPKLTLPLLLMHGGADGLASPEGSKILHERATSRDKTLRIFDGFYHEIFNEPGKEEIIALMTRWLDAHV